MAQPDIQTLLRDLTEGLSEVKTDLKALQLSYHGDARSEKSLAESALGRIKALEAEVQIYRQRNQGISKALKSAITTLLTLAAGSAITFLITQALGGG